MNKKIYIVHEAGTWGKKVAKGLALCQTEGASYSFCASRRGLGIDHKACEQEFRNLMSCIKTKSLK